MTDSKGVCHTIRGCGGAGYQQGYVLAYSGVGGDDEVGLDDTDSEAIFKCDRL